MIKSILTYTSIFLGLYFLSFGLHESYIANQAEKLPFSLKKVYLFHLGFSTLICVNFQLLSTVDKFFAQLGFIYLGTLLLKIVLFAVVFYQSIFSEETLSQTSRISLLIPALLFLLTEAFFVVKILNKKEI